MATGDPFYCFSSEGAYNIASANASQNVAGTATTTTTTYSGGGLLGGLTYGNAAGLANQAYHTTVQYVSNPSTLSDYLAAAAAPAKQVKRKLKGVLANLRSEIDGWHGDILDRCPA